MDAHFCNCENVPETIRATRQSETLHVPRFVWAQSPAFPVRQKIRLGLEPV
jgi:hypothetical protein